MTNEEYLAGIKKAEEKRIAAYNIDFDQLVCNEPNDETRKLKALEIIAETLISINANLEHIGNEVSAIKNLQ